MAGETSSWDAPGKKPDEGLAEWGNAQPRRERPIAVRPPAGNGPDPGAPPAARRRRRWVRPVLWSVGGLLVILVIVGALAPMIAGRLAPGIVERAVAGQIAGSVRVSSVRIGWRGPTTIGPVELRDDRGNPVGVLQVKAPVGAWRVLREAWWSRKDFDFGAVEVTGSMHLVRGTDDKTNLDHALAPGPKAKPPKPKTGKGGVESVRAVLRLVGLDVTYTDKKALADSPLAEGIGLTGFGGDLALAYDAAGSGHGPGGATAKGELSGALRSGRAASKSGDKLRITIDTDIKQNDHAGLQQLKALCDITGAPVDLVDGVMGLKGELVRSVGPRAALRIDAGGAPDNARATVKLEADGATIDLATLYKDGVLTAEKPGRIWVRSTGFVAELPALRDRLADVRKHARVDQPPALEATIDSLHLPIPPEKLGIAPATRGPRPPAPPPSEGLDLSAASVQATVTLGEIKGVQNFDSLATSPPGPQPTAAGAKAAAPGAPDGPMKPFTVAPLVVKLDAADLKSKPARLTASTKATVDGQPAGDLNIDATATGLLDETGRFAMNAIKRLEGEARLTNLNTALAQPVISAAGLQADLPQDIGKTINMRLAANLAGSPAGDERPPTEIDLQLESTNAHATGKLRIEKGVLTSVGDGVVIKLDSAVPLANRMLNKPADAGAAGARPAAAGKSEPGSALAFGGKGGVTITARNVSFPMPAKAEPTAGAPRQEGPTLAQRIKDARADVELALDDLAVTVIPAPPPPADQRPAGVPAPSQARPPAPVVISRLTATATLKPGSTPTVAAQGALTHQGAPFTLAANLAAPGLLEERVGKQAPARIEQLLLAKPTGRVQLTDVPKSLTSLVPALQTAIEAGTVGGGDPATEAKRLAQGLVGDKVNLTVALEPGAGQGNQPPAERISIDVKGTGINAALAANLTTTELALQTLTADTTLRPADVNPLLASLTVTEAKPAAPGAPGQPAPNRPAAAAKPAEPMRLTGPVTLHIKADPLAIPLDPATGAPKLEGARGEAVVHATADQPVVLTGLPLGETGPGEAIGLQEFSATAHAPLAGVLASNAEAGKPAPKGEKDGAEQPAAFQISAKVIRAGIGQGAPPPALVANLRADGTMVLATKAGQATIALTDVSSAQLDTLLGGPGKQPGQVTGALGDKANITLVARTRRGEAPAVPAGGAPAEPPLLVNADLKIDSPRLKGDSIKLAVDADRIQVDPSRLTWTPSAAWVNDLLTSAPPPANAPRAQQDQKRQGPVEGLADVLGKVTGQDRNASPAQPAQPQPGAPEGGAGPGRLTQDVTFNLDIKKAVVALPKSDRQGNAVQGPLKPGVFALDAQLSSPGGTLERDGGKSVRFEDIQVALASKEPGTISLDANIGRVSGEGVTEGAKKSVLSATITGLADERGTITRDKAILNLNADLDSFPTALVDKLTNRNGLLIDALGPTVSLKASARQLSLAADAKGGTLDAQATAPRMQGTLKGQVQNEVFVQNGPLEVKILEVMSTLVTRLAGSVPLVASLEKTAKDDPGIIKAENLTFSTASPPDHSKLNGTVTIDLGTAEFQMKDFISKLLKFADQRSAGTVGRKIEPFVIHMTNGVLTYDRFKLPLGEISIETRGEVNLVNRSINIVTYVPFLALSDEAAGLFNTSLAGKLGPLDRNTLVPISTKGSLDNPKTEIDLGLFLKEFGPNLVKEPGKLIDDVLKNLGKKPKK